MIWEGGGENEKKLKAIFKKKKRGQGKKIVDPHGGCFSL